VDRPAEQPRARDDDRKARQDETTELPGLLLCNPVDKQALQFVSLDVRRADDEEVGHDAPPQ